MTRIGFILDLTIQFRFHLTLTSVSWPRMMLNAANGLCLMLCVTSLLWQGGVFNGHPVPIPSFTEDAIFKRRVGTPTWVTHSTLTGLLIRVYEL